MQAMCEPVLTSPQLTSWAWCHLLRSVARSESGLVGRDLARCDDRQVTNPAIDPLREGLVMSLAVRLGKRGNLLQPGPGAYSQVGAYITCCGLLICSRGRLLLMSH